MSVSFKRMKTLFQDLTLRYIARKEAYVMWSLISGRIQMDQNISKIILGYIEHAECEVWDQKHDDLLSTITTDQFSFDQTAWDRWEELSFFEKIDIAAHHQKQADKMIPGKRKLEEIYDSRL